MQYNLPARQKTIINELEDKNRASWERYLAESEGLVKSLNTKNQLGK